MKKAEDCGYKIYTEITKELLDSVREGDLIKVNDWTAPYKVMGVSENYFVMQRYNFGKLWYSVCEKKPWPGIRHNAMRGGMFHVSTDNWIFGSPVFFEGEYDFTNKEKTDAYLQTFERGEAALSERRGYPITQIAIKKAAKKEE